MDLTKLLGSLQMSESNLTQQTDSLLEVSCPVSQETSKHKLCLNRERLLLWAGFVFSSHHLWPIYVWGRPHTRQEILKGQHFLLTKGTFKFVGKHDQSMCALQSFVCHLGVWLHQAPCGKLLTVFSRFLNVTGEQALIKLYSHREKPRLDFNIYFFLVIKYI